MSTKIKETINKRKHVLIIGMLSFLLLIMQPTQSVKAEEVTVGDFIVTGGILDTDYSYNSTNGILEIKTGEAIHIKNADPETPTNNRIQIASETNANITLSGVNIYAERSPLVIDEMASLNLILAEGTTNTLIGDSYSYPSGILVRTTASLTIGGTGTLMAKGYGNGSGIGGASSGKNGDITINSGTIIAIGSRGAGIGSGGVASSSGSNINGNITINGGTVFAYAILGAGIGTGYGCSEGTPGEIKIYGGKVTAIGSGDVKNSGIGKGGEPQLVDK